MHLNVRLLYYWMGVIPAEGFRMAYSSSNYNCSATWSWQPILCGCQGDQHVSALCPMLTYISYLDCVSVWFIWITLALDIKIRTTKIRLFVSFTSCNFLCFPFCSHHFSINYNWSESCHTHASFPQHFSWYNILWCIVKGQWWPNG